MVYRAILGSEAPSNPAIRAFLKGLNLTCRNGLTLSKVCAMFVSRLFVF